MSIVLHIGLHKTATKYFQHHVFPLLDDEKFIYNPPKLDQLLLDYLKAEEDDKKEILEYLFLEYKKLATLNPNKTILLSREAMSGNLFSAYKYWDYSVELLKKAFPNAKIIIFLRNQIDWLVSCYRESVHEHHYQSIDKFLSFDKRCNSFKSPERSRNCEGFACLDALSLDYSKMIKKLFNSFGEDNVNVLFLENFKKDSAKTTKKLLAILGSAKVEPIATKGIPNRGYSALSIELSIRRYELAIEHGLENLIHRPIFFYGEQSIPAGNMSLSILNKSKYWSDYYLRDNEEVRSANYPERSSSEQKEYEASWRYIVKNILDKSTYADWDMLDGMRSILHDHYRTINEPLKSLLKESYIPEEY